MAAGAVAALHGRDPAVDAARVAALVVVVCAHVLLVTVVTDPGTGAVSNVMVPTRYSWFWWVSWIVQIMPLFFVVGGFASAVSWSRFRERAVRDDGDTARCASATAAGALWVRMRLLRLAQPAALLWIVLAAGTVAALALQVPAGYLDAALSGIGMHLWFLGAYAICLAAAPLTHAAHRRRPYLTMGVLLGLSAGVEILRIAVDDAWWGLAGLAPIWMAIHQLGYFRADGTLGRLRPVHLAVIAACGYGAIWVLGSTGAWSTDMLANLNPPTVSLVLLGLSQACLLQVFSGPLASAMRSRTVQAIAWTVGSRPVTLYLWHLPVIVAVMAVWWLAGGPQPEPGGARWWLLRIPLTLLCWVCVLIVVRMLGRWEAGAVAPDAMVPRVADGGTATWVPVATGLILMVAPAVLEIRFLLSSWLVLGGAASYLVAVVLLRRVPGAGRGRDPEHWRSTARVG